MEYFYFCNFINRYYGQFNVEQIYSIPRINGIVGLQNYSIYRAKYNRCQKTNISLYEIFKEKDIFSVEVEFVTIYAPNEKIQFFTIFDLEENLCGKKFEKGDKIVILPELKVEIREVKREKMLLHVSIAKIEKMLSKVSFRNVINLIIFLQSRPKVFFLPLIGNYLYEDAIEIFQKLIILQLIKLYFNELV